MRSSIVISACGNRKVHPIRLRVMLYSDVLPENKSGGELVLYRHLIESREFDVLSEKPTQLRLFRSRFWKSWKNTRLFSLFNTIEDLCQKSSCEISVMEAARHFKPDVILTVAHGRGYHQAVSLARTLKRPLVAIYHDWWPDLNSTLPCFRWLGAWRFQWVAHQSQICLCVCTPMLEQIGCYDHSVVLPPVPGSFTQVRSQESRGEDGKFRIGYFGSMFDYGEMLENLAEAAETQVDIRIEFRGNRPNWALRRIKALRSSGILLPFVPRNELECWIGGLDAILCVMSFDPKLRRRMETSFPSKLIESLQFKKPIIIWGPEYCSAVKWARDTGAAFCVTVECPNVALNQFRDLASSQGKQRTLAAAARELGKSDLSRETIQRKFVNELHKLARPHST